MSMFQKKLESAAGHPQGNDLTADRVYRRSQDMVSKYMKRQRPVLDDETMAFICRQLRIGVYDPDMYPLAPTMSTLLTETMAREQRAVVLKKDREKVYVAMADPMNTQALDIIETTTGLNVEPVYCPNASLTQLLDAVYPQKTKDKDEPGTALDSEEETPHRSETPKMDVTPSWRRVKESGEALHGFGMVGYYQRSTTHPIGKDLTKMIRRGMESHARSIEIISSDPPVARFCLSDTSVTELPVQQASRLVAVVQAEIGLDVAWGNPSHEHTVLMETDGEHIPILLAGAITPQGGLRRLVLPVERSGVVDPEELGFDAEESIALTGWSVSPEGCVLLVSPAIWWQREVQFMLAAKAAMSGRNVGCHAGRRWMEFATSEPRFDDLFSGRYDVVFSESVKHAARIDALTAASLSGTSSIIHVTGLNAAHGLRRLVHAGADVEFLEQAIRLIVVGRDFRRNCPHCLRRAPIDEETVKRLPEALHDIDGMSESPGCDRCQGTGSLGRIAVAEVIQPTLFGQDIHAMLNAELPPPPLSTPLETKARELVKNGRIRVREYDGVG
ncbi:hypothetical protein [Desulfovibrio inopinatus]|uniref:ATPase, T2SS/T4P/T4SS family n=1 Tax=Desulfovibrio inopinatus TaxID=102109 RepID=UPI0004027D77|nr:hypothetical protein [Desulfovibrio inopinatus]